MSWLDDDEEEKVALDAAAEQGKMGAAFGGLEGHFLKGKGGGDLAKYMAGMGLGGAAGGALGQEMGGDLGGTLGGLGGSMLGSLGAESADEIGAMGKKAMTGARESKMGQNILKYLMMLKGK